MSDLTSILASTFLPETPSLNNSQTLIASGNIFNSGGFTAEAGTAEILKAFGNYRPRTIPEKFTNGDLIVRARQFTTSHYVRPENIKAVYLVNKGLVPAGELPGYVSAQDSFFENSSDAARLLNNNIDYSPSGFIRVGMILDVNNKVSYLYKGVIAGAARYVHDQVDTYPIPKNPPPLIGQAASDATKKTGATLTNPRPVPTVSKPPTVKPGKKPGADANSTNPEPELGITGAQAAAAAANKPGAPAADTKAPVSDTPVFKLSEKFDPAANFFRIIYADAGNSIKSFVFTFLPARETKIGNWNVPEARTGVPIQTKMRHKMQVVPGAGPIVQTIGINGTTVTLVGALLGNEVIAEDFATGGPNSRPIYANSNKVQGTNTYAEGAYPGALPSGAYDKAVELQRRLVYPGRPVTIEIKPSSTQATFQMKADGSTNRIGDFIRMTGVITAIRLQHAHSDRCYYALDLFVTDYPEAPAAKPNTNQVLKDSDLKITVKGTKQIEALNRALGKFGGLKPGAESKAKDFKINAADRNAKQRAATTKTLTPQQNKELQKLIEAAPASQKADVLNKYLIKIGSRASLDTRLGIDEGVDYAEQLANANPEAASESSAIAADYLSTVPTKQAPVGLSIASISEQLSNNIQAAATPDNVLSAISNATAGTLRPAQQKAALEKIATRTDLDPTQLNYLTDAIGRYAA
jgi:hypothetical protein